MNSHHSLWTIFRWPLMIGALSLIGLVGALLGDDLWDWLGAALIAGTVGVVVRVSWRAKGAQRNLGAGQVASISEGGGS